MIIFYRGSYSQAVITVQSNEVLGDLDTSFVEDYYGNDGQLSFYSLSAGTRSPFLVNWIDDTRTAFRGWLPLSIINDGVYELQGRVRDVVGNYTILSDYFDIAALGQKYTLAFEVAAGNAFVPPYFDPVMHIEGQYDEALKLPSPYTQSTLTNYVATQRLRIPRPG